jgi:hypothetical protein
MVGTKISLRNAPTITRVIVSLALICLGASAGLVLLWHGADDPLMQRRQAEQAERAALVVEAQRWAKDLANASPDEVKARLFLGPVADQLPRWRDAHFTRVIPLFFHQISNEQAARLLPLLWDLRGDTSSDETVLFAAACFGEVSHPGYHRAYASRLLQELKDLAECPWGEFINVHGNTPEWREKGHQAVRYIVQMAGKTPAVRDWLWAELVNRKRHWIEREEVILQLGLLLGNDSALQQELQSIIGTASEDLSVRASAVEALGNAWAPGTGLQQFLLGLLHNKQEVSYLRATAARTLGQVWGAQNWVRELLTRILQNSEETDSLRRHVVETLGQVFGREEWLRQLLLDVANRPEEYSPVRAQAMTTLGQLWGRQPWLRKIIKPILNHSERKQPERVMLCGTMDPGERHMRDHTSLCREIVSDLNQVWGREEWVWESLTAIWKNPGEDEMLRYQVLEALMKTWHRSEKLWDLLAKPLQSPQGKPPRHPSPLTLSSAAFADIHSLVWQRSTSVSALGEVWGRDERLKSLLLDIIHKSEEDPMVIQQCVATLGQTWGREDWLRSLLLVIVEKPPQYGYAFREALDALGRNWGRDEELRRVMIRIVTQTNADVSKRQKAADVLVDVWGKQAWLRDLLVAIVKDPQQHKSLRNRIVFDLGRTWGREDWLRALLTELLQTAETNGEVHSQAKHQLFTLWPPSKSK